MPLLLKPELLGLLGLRPNIVPGCSEVRWDVFFGATSSESNGYRYIIFQMAKKNNTVRKHNFEKKNSLEKNTFCSVQRFFNRLEAARNANSRQFSRLSTRIRQSFGGLLHLKRKTDF